MKRRDTDTTAIRLAVAGCCLLGGAGPIAWRMHLSARPRVRVGAPGAVAGAGDARAATEWVDVGGVPLATCALAAVAFRSQAEGWVTDYCGHAFHTSDGGLTFAPLPANDGSLALTDLRAGREDDLDAMAAELESRAVTRIEWIDDQRAAAFGMKEDATKISVDGGATWRRPARRTRGLDGIYASDHAGESVWACGASGAIWRSRDGGATFAPTRSTPFRRGDRCMALSFVDGRLGWVGGMNGTLFASGDGGDHWRRVRPPRQPAIVPGLVEGTAGRPVWDLQTTGVALLARGRGWVNVRTSGDRVGTFFTADDGATWSEARPPADVQARLGSGGRWGSGVVLFWDGRLRFSFAGDLVRETPLIARRSPAREAVRGREPLDGAHVAAWTDHAVVESFDGGRSWSTVQTVKDGAIRRVAHVGRRLLIDLADGRILDGPQPSRQPELDRFFMVMTEAHRRGATPPPGPMACLSTATEGAVDLSFGQLGCFESDEGTARLSWTAQTATLTGRQGEVAHLTAAARTELLRSLVAAVERADDGDSGCTTHVYARLTWRCGTAPPLHAAFDESACPSGGRPATGTAHRILAALVRDF